MEKIRKKPVKLIELIRTLDRKEFNSFGRYVNSMVKDKNVHKLFLELKRYAPNFELSQKDKEKVFEKIFGKKKYSNRQLNYLTSAMNLHLEEYLIMIAIRQDQKQKDYMLMEYYRSRKQYEFFKRTAESIMEREEEKAVKDGEYYLTKMKIEYDLYHYVETDNKRIERQAKRIESMVNSIDEFYMYYKLNLASDLITFDEDFNVERDVTLFLEEIKNVIKAQPLYKNTLIKIYLFILNNFKKHTYENYLSLRQKIFEVIDNVSDEHQRTLFSCLSNYAITCNEKNIPNFKKYTFEIIQMSIDRKYAVRNGELGYQNFINAVIIATNIEINNISWAKEMIIKNNHLINVELREDTILLSKAFIDYAEKNYGDALEKLNQIEHWRQYTFGIQGRLLKLKCYYELDIETNGNYLDTAEYLADSYRNYLRRNKIFSDPINKSIINLITFTIKIMRNRYSKKYTPNELLNEMKKYEPLAAKRWVLEIIKTHLQKKKTA